MPKWLRTKTETHCFGVSSRVPSTEIPACLIVLYSSDFAKDPLLQWAHKEGARIIWKEVTQQPIIATLFEIWSDYIQNIGKKIAQFHEQQQVLKSVQQQKRNESQNESQNVEEKESKEDGLGSPVSSLDSETKARLSGGVSSFELFNPLCSAHTLFSLKTLLDIFLRCIIFQNQMELFSGRSRFYLRFMSILMNLMKLLIGFVAADSKEYRDDDTLLGIVCRIVVAIRMMIGCCENIFEEKENRMIAFFLELARYTDTFERFNDLIHNGSGVSDKYSERLKKDSRVVVRVSKYFEEAITLEFQQWKTEDIQTPFHRERAMKLVRETLNSDEFEIPPPKLNGQYLGYQESSKQEIKFFNDLFKQSIANTFITQCIS